jgi:small subunit ribosomal protein S24e
MEITIDGKKENKSLERNEVAFTIKFEKVIPSRKEVREELARMLSADAKLLVVDAMNGIYGAQAAKGTARTYKDAKRMAVERRYLLVRNGLVEKKEKKKVEKKAPAKK